LEGVSSEGRENGIQLKRALALILLAAATSLGISLVALGQGTGPAKPAVAPVVWSERPQSVDELADLSESVVEAEVISIADGPPLPAEDPEHEIPTERVTFKTVSVLDGASPGPQFLLFRTGSQELRLANDPPYEIGERYVLFIRPREGEPGTYLPVAPDGRLRLDAGRDAEAMIGGPVGREVEGRSVPEIESEVSR